MELHRSNWQRRNRQVIVWALTFFCVAQAASYVSLCLTAKPERFTSKNHSIDMMPNACETIVHWQCHYVLHSAAPADIVFLGDSSCLMGVMPNVLVHGTATRIRNLGTLGAMSSTGHAELLQLFIERHGTPKLLVYYVCPYTLMAKSKDIDEIGCLQRFREHVAPEVMRPDAANPRSWLPSYHVASRLVAVIEKRFLAQRLDEPRGIFFSDRAAADFMEASHGFLLNPGPLEKKQPTKTTYFVELSPDAIGGLVRLFEIAGAHRFPVVVMLNPMSENHQTEETTRLVGIVEANLRQLVKPYPQAQIAAPFLRYYSADSFVDRDHLGEIGARRNSAELGKWLAGSYRTLLRQDRDREAGPGYPNPEASSGQQGVNFSDPSGKSR